MEPVKFEDKMLTCKDCKVEFKHSARDQEFFAKMNFVEPKRCRACRDAMKARREGH